MLSQQLSMAGMMQNEQIQIVSLNVYPTRNYHDQWRRNYTMQMTGQTEAALHDMLAQYGPDRTFSNFGISQLNSIQTGNSGQNVLNQGGLIRYSPTPTNQVQIAHGWGSKRARFEMVVNTLQNGVPKFREIIVGYTDHYGVSHLGQDAVLDHNMIFTIDSVVREPIEQVYGVAGMTARNQVGTADVIITNQASAANPFATNQNTLYTMRPQDVFVIADSMEMINGSMDGDYMTQAGPININQKTYVADTLLSHMAKPSNRRNDLLNSYTSRLMTNMYQASAVQASPASDDFLSPQSQAMLRVKEQHMSGYGFAFVITRLAGASCSTTGQFTYSELLRICPEIDRVTTVFQDGEINSNQIMLPPTDYCQTAYSVNDHSIMATMVSNTILALMNTHGLMQVSCICDNQTGQPRCVVNGALGPTEENRNTIVGNFENAVVLELLGVIAASGIGLFQISVYAEAFNIVYINIRLNGELQDTPFVFPGWASAANTPVVSNDFNMLTSMADSVNHVVSSSVHKAKTMQQQIVGSMMPGMQPQLGSGAPIIQGVNSLGNPMADFPSATSPANPPVNW